jgi:thiamine kinase-like enzyme
VHPDYHPTTNRQILQDFFAISYKNFTTKFDKTKKEDKSVITATKMVALLWLVIALIMLLWSLQTDREAKARLERAEDLLDAADEQRKNAAAYMESCRARLMEAEEYRDKCRAAYLAAEEKGE